MKQKLVSILLVLCMVVALVPAIALTSAAANTSAGAVTDGTLPDGATVETGTATAFSGGDGTPGNPYQIKDVTEFRYFQSFLLGDSKAEYLTKSYILTGDIVFNAKFNSLGEDGVAQNYTNNSLHRFSAKGNGDTKTCAVPGDFSGTFDGNGKGIYNCYMRFDQPGVGFFEKVSGTVKNLNLYGGYIYFGGNGAAGTFAAVLAGGTISNCYSSVDVYTKAQYTAGIAGHVTTAESKIENCTYAGSINASSVSSYYQVAGIAARVETALTVSGCINRANMTADCSRVGGIVGMMNAGGKKLLIENCANYGNLTTTSTTDHGIAGIFAINNTGNIAIEGCANYGNVTGSDKCRAAGIVGGSSASGWTIRNCANYGNISGLGASGVCVYSNGGIYANNYAEGTYSQPGDMASSLLIGWVKSATTIQNSVGVGKNLYQKNTDVVTESNTKLYSSKDELNISEAVNVLNAGLETPVWVAGETAPELKWIADMNATPAPEITIDGASLTIGGNVTMNLFVKKTTVVAAGVTLGKISIVDNDNTPYEVTDDSGDYYVFTIKGLRASEFGKNKVYHVQYTTADAPGTPIDCTATKEYSPLQYAINMYNADDKTETVTDLDKLLLSIVNYADAAAKTTVASTAFKAAHADADFSMLPTFADIIAEDTGVYDYDEKRKDDQHLPSISANLTETIALTLTFDGSDLYQTGNDNMMMIGNAEIPGKVNTLSVVFSELFATDLYNTITFTFVETYESGLVVTATTSLVQFLKSYQGTAEEALAAATAQYLYVARLFCLNNQPNA